MSRRSLFLFDSTVLCVCVCVHVILLDGGKKRCRAGSPTRLRVTVTLLPLVCRTLMMPKVTQFQSDEINENEENEWSVTAPLVQHFSPYM